MFSLEMHGKRKGLIINENIHRADRYEFGIRRVSRIRIDKRCIDQEMPRKMPELCDARVRVEAIAIVRGTKNAEFQITIKFLR